MKICSNCGGAILADREIVSYSGSYCSCKYESKPICNHCYCQEVYVSSGSIGQGMGGSIRHKKCCMCGHQYANREGSLTG